MHTVLQAIFSMGPFTSSFNYSLHFFQNNAVTPVLPPGTQNSCVLVLHVVQEFVATPIHPLCAPSYLIAALLTHTFTFWCNYLTYLHALCSSWNK